uniref:Elongation factor Ts n=1 Tax=Candidatus Kentrum sp. TUN TaxID=2126343 RepID=A0A450ZME8_9GAMM|nr:MAG: translation elongation factor Ts (EF-Ts) [Candidatus Kentron sp. TUN]VFK58600.1 MAG: translation elongation factor Ts (EF-Ts) [Candidatus Kentron sp. TUN]VFK61144.1 MAG: translation elongation factor Ts (EF-Ts) [Candidatus Kentron sp. TUN]
MGISAALVKELRERTGAGMMECKKALLGTSGDIEAAIESMRKSGQAKVDKRAGRVAAEGIIAMHLGQDSRRGVMVEINCETDFVAKGGDFQGFADHVAKRAFEEQSDSLEGLLKIPMEKGDTATIEGELKKLIARIGENLTVRRFNKMETQNGILGAYLHRGRIGVFVELSGGGDSDVAKDIAMHIAANRPLCINEKEIPLETKEKERDIFRAQAAATGKPPEIIEKMIIGRMNKFVSEVTLLGQPFVKDPDISVQKFLAKSGASVSAFTRFEVGEGIEKKAENFADEVMAQVRGDDKE